MTPSALNVAYGDTPNLSAYGYTVTNYNAGDSGGVTGTLSGTTNYAAGDNAGGIYYIDYASGALASAQGYNFTYANNASAITVVKEDITAAFINSLSKIYGTANPSIDYTNFTFSTLYGSDGSSLFSSITPNFGGVNGTTSVGSAYAISASIADTMNYHVINTPGTTLAITARTVTIDPTAGQSKIYGTSDPVLTYGTAAATGTTGLVNGDNLSGNLSYNNAGQYTNVGTYATTLGTLSNSNYNIVLENNAPTFGITRRSVTINPTAGQSKIYGMVDPNLAYTTDVATGTNGLVNNDTLNGNISYQGAGHYTGVGNYATTLGNLSNSNYNIVLGSSTPTFGITQRSVTVDPTAGQSKIYGAADPVIAYNTDPVTGTTGLVNGDTLSGRLSYVGAGQYTNVGSYAMTLGNVSNGNYNIALQVAAPTYAITKRDVTATLANKNLNSGAIFSVLDQNNPADVAWSGLVGSDTPVNLDSVTFSYGGAMPGMVNPTGSYNLGIASFADNNYNLSSFTSGLLTIGALPPVMAQPQLPSTVLRIGINAGLSQGGVMSFNNFGNQIVMQIDGEYTSGSMATINDEDPLLLDSSANDSQSVTNNFYSNQIIFVSIDPKLVAQLNLLNK